MAPTPKTRRAISGRGRKHPRSAFVERVALAPRKAPAPKANGGNAVRSKVRSLRLGAKSTVDKQLQRFSFAAALKQTLTESPQLDRTAAVMQAGKAMPGTVQSRDRTAWYDKLEEAAGGKLTPDNIDIQVLCKHRGGQGRTSEWSDASTKRLVKYLLTRPKKGSGNAVWPSCARLAHSPALQKKYRVPSQSERRYQQVAATRLVYRPRYARAYLTAGMIKRRIAFEERYGEKTKEWWRGTAFQDEGHIDPWQEGPLKTWQDPTKPPETKAKVKGRSIDGHTPKINFSVMFGYGCKAPLYMYTKNLNAAEGVKMMSRQWKPFFTANPHIKRLICDAAGEHPGNGKTQSLKCCKYWNNHLSHIELLGAKNEWVSRTGEDLEPHLIELVQARRKVVGATPAGQMWMADSPDLNPAEHCVAAIVAPSTIAEGSYTHEQLKKIANTNWANHPQSSLDRSIDSMVKRVAGLKETKGGALLRHHLGY